MVVSTYKELIFKKSKKQHQILAQTAYYQAGKIVIQTILPEQPPVALITLNTLGTTCSTSADTYIPIENISNTQSCSFLESRLVSLYGGKAASLLIEYQQRLSLYLPLYVYPSASFPSFLLYPEGVSTNIGDVSKAKLISASRPFRRKEKMLAKQSVGVKAPSKFILAESLRGRGFTKGGSKEGLRSGETSRGHEALHSFLQVRSQRSKGNISLASQGQDLLLYPLGITNKASKAGFERTKVKGSISISSSFPSEGKSSEKVGFANDFVDNTFIYANKEPISYFNKLINNVQSWVLDPSKLTPLQTGLTKNETKRLSLVYCKARLAKTYFAGTGNNIFQSTLGNIEIQTATRLATIMVNYWNFYSLNKTTAFFLSDAKLRTQRKNSTSFTSCPKEMLVLVRSKSPMLTKESFASPSEAKGYSKKEVQDVSISTYKVKKGSSKAGPSLIPKPKRLVNSYLFEKNQRQAFFAMQSRGLDPAKQAPLSFAASQVYYLASFTDAFASLGSNREPFSKAKLRVLSFARKAPPSDTKQLVGVKGRRGSLNKGFEEIAEGYKPQPATDSSVNEVNRSVKGTPPLSRLFTPKQYKALRLCIPSDAQAIPLLSFAYPKGLAKLSQESGVEKQGVADPLSKRRVVQSKEGVKQSRPLLAPTFHYDKYNVKVLGIKSKVKDKTLKAFAFKGFPCKAKGTKSAKLEETYKCKDLHFAIMQSKNSLKICENKNLSYNIRRLSVENIGGYSQLNNNNFQLINSLQFSNLQRDRFYPNWFRLYLPDIEATEFLKNVANYYFSLGLQTFTLPSTKLNPFSTFLNKYTLNLRGSYSSYSLLQRSINISYYNLLTSCASSTNYASPSFLLYPEGLAKLSTNLEDVSEAQGVNQRVCITDAVGIPSCFAFPSAPKEAKSAKPISSLQSKGRGADVNEGTTSPSDKMLAKCEEVESLGGWVSTARPKRAFTEEKSKNSVGITPESVMADSSISEVTHSVGMKALWGIRGLRSWESVAEKQRSEQLKVKDSSCTKIAKDQLDTAFSLLVENQIFPLNYNDFSIVEKELLYNTLVNSCFAKAFYLINQNRQLLDFFVDYLLRFQILRQHQILYLFSTLLVGCNKSQITLANL